MDRRAAFSGSWGRQRSEIPVFSGEDAYVWVTRMERYFKANAVDDRYKLQTATMAMEGRALNWYRFWAARTPEATWASFKTALVQRFQPAIAQNPYEMLLSIRQTGTVGKYRERFKMFSEPLDADEDLLKAVFMNGPREDVRAEERLHKLDMGLSELMDQAQLVENENENKNRMGMPPPPLLRLWGEIEGNKVIVVVVASGTSNSLIAKRVVNELRLPVS